MKVRDLMRDLFELPQDDILNIQYFHENSQGKRIDCDIHDFLVGSGTIRSKTFPGIAKAMARQWGGN